MNARKAAHAVGISLVLLLAAGPHGARADDSAIPVVTNKFQPDAKVADGADDLLADTNAPPPKKPQPQPRQPHPEGRDSLPPEVLQVKRMLDSGVGESVVLAYIRNSPKNYALTPDQIITLHDMRVSGPVIQAMIEHSPDGRKQPRPEPVRPAVTKQGAVMDLDTDAVFIPGPPPVPSAIQLEDFYQVLAPYGQWRQFPGLGWCWRPAMVGPSWRPYRDDGNWLWSDCGWYWNSDYPWGWATFHYGRWWRHPRDGWMWMPDLKWAPAWVCWRKTDDYIGWAPLPPGADFALGVGWTFRDTPVGPHSGFALPGSSFTFVPFANFTDEPVDAVLTPASVNALFRKSTVENHFSLGRNNRIIDWGTGLAQIRAANGGRLDRVAVVDRESSSPQPGLKLRSGLGGPLLNVTNDLEEPFQFTAPAAQDAPMFPGYTQPWLDAAAPMGGGEAFAEGGVSFGSDQGGDHERHHSHHHHHESGPGDHEWQPSTDLNTVASVPRQEWMNRGMDWRSRNMPFMPIGFGRIGSGMLGFGTLGGGTIGMPGFPGATPWLALGPGPTFATGGLGSGPAFTGSRIGPGPTFADTRLLGPGPTYTDTGLLAAQRGVNGIATWQPASPNGMQAMSGGSTWSPAGVQMASSGGSTWSPVAAAPSSSGGSAWLPVGATPSTSGGSPWSPVGSTLPVGGGSPWLPVGATPAPSGGSAWLPVGTAAPTANGSPWSPVGAQPLANNGESPWLPVGAMPPTGSGSPWLPTGSQPSTAGSAWQPTGTTPGMGGGAWLPEGSAPVLQSGAPFGPGSQVPRRGDWNFHRFLAYPSLPSAPMLPSAPLLPASPTLPGGPMLPADPILPGAPAFPSQPMLPSTPHFHGGRPGGGGAGRAFAPASAARAAGGHR